MRIAHWAGFLATLLLIAACGSSEKTPAKDADEVLERWRQAGLDVADHEAFDVEAEAFDQAECRRGAVAKIETTLCRFPGEDQAKKAQPVGLGMVGKTTGAALARGSLLLIVADRDGADPSGKTINKLTKVFLGR